MNTQTNFVRINISIPRDLVGELKKNVPARGVSRFIVEAAREKIEEAKRIKAFKELLKLPPAFTDIKDSAAYIRRMRRLDEKRMKRLGL